MLNSTISKESNNNVSVPNIEQIPMDDISKDQSTQVRVAFNDDAITEYSQHLDAGGELPPVTLIWDCHESIYFIGDGWHRFYAYEKSGYDNIPSIVRFGTQRDALKYALSANLNHGVRRTRADKRHAVETALDDAEWSKLSSRQIADLCGVHHSTVERIRDEKVPDHIQLAKSDSCHNGQDAAVTRRIGRDGKSRRSKPEKKQPKQGSEKITPKQRKDARAAWGKAQRAIEDLGVLDLVAEEVESIVKKLKPIWGDR